MPVELCNAVRKLDEESIVALDKRAWAEDSSEGVASAWPNVRWLTTCEPLLQVDCHKQASQGKKLLLHFCTGLHGST